MTRVPFDELLGQAAQDLYAVSSSECWSLESLVAAADAAESSCLPVLVGFSGFHLPY